MSPGRENAAAKGRLLIAEGRLLVEHVDNATIIASCPGDSGDVYSLSFSPPAGWRCSCPALTRCSHLVALHLVTVAPREAKVA